MLGNRLQSRQAITPLLLLLGVIYQAQGNYAEAEPLYRRSLAILERALGPEHPDVAQSLENYAALLRETGRADEAAEMEARAKAIRAKYE
jgi:tetratricopeptide (TPR) repeat protein